MKNIESCEDGETSAVSRASRASDAGVRKRRRRIPTKKQRYKSLQIPSIALFGTLSGEFGDHFVVTSGLLSVELPLSTRTRVVIVISIRVVSRFGKRPARPHRSVESIGRTRVVVSTQFIVTSPLQFGSCARSAGVSRRGHEPLSRARRPRRHRLQSPLVDVDDALQALRMLLVHARQIVQILLVTRTLHLVLILTPLKRQNGVLECLHLRLNRRRRKTRRVLLPVASTRYRTFFVFAVDIMRRVVDGLALRSLHRVGVALMIQSRPVRQTPLGRGRLLVEIAAQELLFERSESPIDRVVLTRRLR